MAEKKFEWLTEEICKEYKARADRLPPGTDNTGAWRSLVMELQQRCNITEVQAINILHGHHVKDYLAIYGIESGEIPMPEAMKQRRAKEAKKKTAGDKMKEYEDEIERLQSMTKHVISDFGFEEKD